MKKIISLVLAGVLVLGASALVFAYGGHRGYGPQGKSNHYQRRMNGEERVNLSQAQIEQIEEVKDKYFAKQDDLRDKLRAKKEELRELYFDKEAAKEEIISLQAEINNLRAELADLRMEQRLEMRNILTTEQLGEYENVDRSNLPRFSRRRRGLESRGAQRRYGAGSRFGRGSRGQIRHRGHQGYCGRGFGPRMRY